MVLALLAGCFLLGAWQQRRAARRAARRRTIVWSANVGVLIPIAILYAACTIRLDGELAAAFACGVVGWWLVIGASLAYARVAERGERRARGALAMSAAFPNTIFLGFPLAHMAYGAEGLRIAVMYDVLGPIIPAVVVSTAIARSHAGCGEDPSVTPWAVARGVLVSPPTIAMLVGVALRLLVLDAPLELRLVGEAIGPVAGAAGFLAAGLSMPLGRFDDDARRVAQVVGAVALRMLVAPALLWATGRIVGVAVPPVLLLVAAMPTAIHALVIAREHDLDTELVRLAIVLSTLAALIAVPVAVALR